MSERAAAARFELALEHQRAGRTAAARSAYLDVLAIAPGHDRTLFLLGALELEAGQLQDAIAHLERAVQAAPDNPAVHSNLGLAYRRGGDPERATAALYRAVQLNPHVPQALFNLGLVLRDRRDLGAALVCFSRAADLEPSLFAIQLELADALVKTGQLERSIGHFQAALALQPRSGEAGVGLMGALQLLKRPMAVEVMGQRVLAIDPRLAAAHRLLGAARQSMGQLDSALTCLERALALDPSDVEARYQLGYANMRGGRIEDAVASFRRAVALDEQNAAVHSALIVALAIHPDSTRQTLLAETQAWAVRHAEPWYASALPFPERSRAPDRRLRVGYVSPDFNDHSLRFFMLPLLRQHDRSRYEIVCYSNAVHLDAWTESYRALADHWREIAPLDDAALAQLIRQDEVDILVDLSLHTPRHRLTAFARRPAPVQLSWLGYPGATGVQTIDYHLTDPFLEPPGAAAGGVDLPLHLPHSFWCYDPLTQEPAVVPLPALSAGHVTFGNLNDLCKINPAVLALWARVLSQVERSRLVLLAPPGSARARVQEELRVLGVDPARLQFIERLERSEYLQTYQRIDLCLDCFPYNGHTTSLDSWWMGVPVVTLVGTTPVGRAGLSQAQNLGVTEFVAESPEHFVALAVAASRDLPRLDALRRSLRSRMQASPLMNSGQFSREIELAYRRAWQRWCATEAGPALSSVPSRR